MSRSAVSESYCRRYDIASIGFRREAGVTAAAEPVCHLDVRFGEGYSVQFKLQGRAAGIGETVRRLLGDGSIECARAVDPAALEAELAALFREIDGRLQRIRHEQEVQRIRYLGNTFVLNGKTVFDVVEDVDGRLTIAMHRDGGRQQAMLQASALLDGLYDGSIVMRPPSVA